MAIEAPVSKFKKTNLKIYIGALVIAAVFFGYDGYFSKYEWSKRHKFYVKHVIDNDGVPSSTMVFNQKSPPIFLGGALFFAITLFVIKDKRIVADENELVISDNFKIPYDSIQAIDKTHFEKKGCFTIIYNDQNDSELQYKLSNRKYDNLSAVLEHITAKIS